MSMLALCITEKKQRNGFDCLSPLVWSKLIDRVRLLDVLEPVLNDTICGYVKMSVKMLPQVGKNIRLCW